MIYIVKDIDDAGRDSELLDFFNKILGKSRAEGDIRSDSDFNDCSISSANTALSGNALIAHPLFDKANSISEEKPTAGKSFGDYERK